MSRCAGTWFWYAKGAAGRWRKARKIKPDQGFRPLPVNAVWGMFEDLLGPLNGSDLCSVAHHRQRTPFNDGDESACLIPR